MCHNHCWGFTARLQEEAKLGKLHHHRDAIMTYARLKNVYLLVPLSFGLAGWWLLSMLLGAG